MSGLTTSYILAKLAAAGTTTATKNIILEFLNTVPDAATLAGMEPVEGPIVDDPSYGWGNQVRDYDIGMTVAQRIFTNRPSLGSYTSLTQLSRANGFSPDKFNDLLYAFTTTAHEISSIDFNYHDALNLRKSATTAAPLPAWRKGLSPPISTRPPPQQLQLPHARRRTTRLGVHLGRTHGKRTGTPRDHLPV